MTVVNNSALNETSRGMRTAIAFLGRRNAGKSSLLNALAGYDLAIVSPLAGTTTDPVQKALEINPLGPCLLIDTAGIDDIGELGQKRIEKTLAVINDSDVGIVVVGDGRWTDFEADIVQRFQDKAKPFIIVLNKSDNRDNSPLQQELHSRGFEVLTTAAAGGQGIGALKEKIRSLKIPAVNEPAAIVGDLVKSGDMVLLVVPIDVGAPKGRLILPQVQTIRDLLDHDASAIVVKEKHLESTLEQLAPKPALVIADSQVVMQVAATVPPDIPLTTFSTLLARFKGELRPMLEGVGEIDKLGHGDRVLIAEACTHHAMPDDIGRVKLPRWLCRYTGKELLFDVAAGPNLKQDLKPYKMVIQCGGCTITPTAYRNRIETARSQGVAISNYGIVISHIHGLLNRIIQPFPELQDLAKG